MRPGSVAPRSVQRGLLDARDRGDTQNEVWRAVREYGERVSPGEEADDLAEVHARHVRAMNTVLGRLPGLPDQVGFAILTPRGVGSLECLDSPVSWSVMGRSLVERDVELLGRRRADFDSVFEYKPQKARSVVRAFVRRHFTLETIESGRNWESASIGARDYTGELTVIGDSVIHVSLARKER